MNLIDTHAHTVPENPAYPKNLTAEQLLAKMDAAGVGRTVLIQSTRGAGFDNSYIVGCARKYPDRFKAVCALDAIDPGSAARLDALVAEGVVGCRTKPAGWQPDDERAHALYEAAAEIGVPVTVMGRNSLAAIATVLERFPRLHLVLDHLGDVDVETGISELAELSAYPNLSLKFSSKLFSACRNASVDAVGVLQTLVGGFGASRMMWGSNYPSSHEPEWPYEGTVKAVVKAVAGFSTQEQGLLLAGTAERTWGKWQESMVPAADSPGQATREQG